MKFTFVLGAVALPSAFASSSPDNIPMPEECNDVTMEQSQDAATCVTNVGSIFDTSGFEEPATTCEEGYNAVMDLVSSFGELVSCIKGSLGNECSDAFLGAMGLNDILPDTSNTTECAEDLLSDFPDCEDAETKCANLDAAVRDALSAGSLASAPLGLGVAAALLVAYSS